MPTGTNSALEKKASIAEAIASKTKAVMPSSGKSAMIDSIAATRSCVRPCSASEAAINPTTATSALANNIWRRIDESPVLATAFNLLVVLVAG